MALSFSERLIIWHAREGRKNLPWQINKTPYRVWVSEIMLQQTQVKTVIPYFNRFVKRFPTPQTLARAKPQTVLKYWAGLGYYTRARNLHLAARQLCKRFDGNVPERYEALITLPGIGRSTAGAILALCFDRALPILDGNVKRVIARHENIAGWPGQAAVARQLWARAESLLPQKNVSAYTQAIMDLGSLLCTRHEPACGHCPVARDCKARIQNNIAERPAAAPRRHKPTRSTVMMIITHNDKVLLQRRSTSGVWGGLLCPPEVAQVSEVSHWCRRHFARETHTNHWQVLAHEFTHFKLNIRPVTVRLPKPPRQLKEGDNLVWCRIRDADTAGVPAPVRKLLARLKQLSSHRS